MLTPSLRPSYPRPALRVYLQYTVKQIQKRGQLVPICEAFDTGTLVRRRHSGLPDDAEGAVKELQDWKKWAYVKLDRTGEEICVDASALRPYDPENLPEGMPAPQNVPTP